MHVEILKRERFLKTELKEQRTLDDDEIDLKSFLNKLSFNINEGSQRELEDSLEKVQRLNLKTVLRSLNGNDYVEVRL